MNASVPKFDSSRKDRGFERDQCAGFSLHAWNYKQIYAY
jgi:hypothetical protein